MLVSNNLILSGKGEYLLRFLDTDAENSPQTEDNLKKTWNPQDRRDFYPKTQSSKFKIMKPKKKSVKYKDISHYHRNKK